MKRNQLKVVFASIFLLTFLVTSCSNSNDDEPNYTKATIGHSGFDFSEGAIAADWSVDDGYVTSWQPDNGNNTTYPNNVNHFWWTTHTSANTNELKDMGTVAMSSVTQAPTSWEIAPDISPLLVDHVYVAKCLDGYVKFKVLSINSASVNWEVDIEYFFSTTATF